MDNNDDSPHPCIISFTTMDHVVVNAFRENELMDNRFPVQLIDSKFLEDVSLEHDMAIQ